eukprot:13674538-Ditylum_brightwellii.AAC.2
MSSNGNTTNTGNNTAPAKTRGDSSGNTTGSSPSGNNNTSNTMITDSFHMNLLLNEYYGFHLAPFLM